MSTESVNNQVNQEHEQDQDNDDVQNAVRKGTRSFKVKLEITAHNMDVIMVIPLIKQQTKRFLKLLEIE